MSTVDDKALHDETASRIRAYIVESFLFGDDSGVGDDDSLIESGVIDSTGVMEVVAFLEETFAIEIDEEDLVADNLDSVNRLTRFVGRQLPREGGRRDDAEEAAS